MFVGPLVRFGKQWRIWFISIERWARIRHATWERDL